MSAATLVVSPSRRQLVQCDWVHIQSDLRSQEEKLADLMQICGQNETLELIRQELQDLHQLSDSVPTSPQVPEMSPSPLPSTAGDSLVLETGMTKIAVWQKLDKGIQDVDKANQELLAQMLAQQAVKVSSAELAITANEKCDKVIEHNQQLSKQVRELEEEMRTLSKHAEDLRDLRHMVRQITANSDLRIEQMTRDIQEQRQRFEKERADITAELNLRQSSAQDMIAELEHLQETQTVLQETQKALKNDLDVLRETSTQEQQSLEAALRNELHDLRQSTEEPRHLERASASQAALRNELDQLRQTTEDLQRFRETSLENQATLRHELHALRQNMEERSCENASLESLATFGNDLHELRQSTEELQRWQRTSSENQAALKQELEEEINVLKQRLIRESKLRGQTTQEVLDLKEARRTKSFS